VDYKGDDVDYKGDDVDYKTEQLKEKINKLQRKIDRLNILKKDLLEKKDQQIFLTDPLVRSMTSSGRDSGMFGYNV